MDWKKIRAVTMDVDGVLTDGGLEAHDNHEMVRVFNAKDSFSMRVAAMRGLFTGVFSGGNTEGVLNRLATSGVAPEDMYLGCRGKIRAFEDFCSRHGVDPSEVLYIGDDVPDVPVLKAAGIGAVPADAAKDAMDAADYICELPGGRGCVREVVEKILRKQGRWHFEGTDFEMIF